MRKGIIRVFRGIAPKLGRNLPLDHETGRAYSITARDVDLRDGKPAPLKGPLLEEVRTVAVDGLIGNSLVKFNDEWFTGNNRHFLKSLTQQANVLFSITNGVLIKRIENDAGGYDIANVGQPLPVAPTLATQSIGAGGLADADYSYVYTTIRNIGNLRAGTEDELDSQDDWETYISESPYPGQSSATEFPGFLSPSKLAKNMPYGGWPTRWDRANRSGTRDAIADGIAGPLDDSTYYREQGGYGLPQYATYWFWNESPVRDGGWGWWWPNFVAEPLMVGWWPNPGSNYGSWPDEPIGPGGRITAVKVNIRIRETPGFVPNPGYLSPPADTLLSGKLGIIGYTDYDEDGVYEYTSTYYGPDFSYDTTFQTFTETWTTCPWTGLDWTVQDFNYIERMYFVANNQRHSEGEPETEQQSLYNAWDIADIWLSMEWEDWHENAAREYKLDLGANAIGGKAVKFYAQDIRPQNADVTYVIEASPDDVTYTPLTGSGIGGEILNGDTIALQPLLYRYFKVDVQMTTDSAAYVPQIDWVRLYQEGDVGRHQDESGPCIPVELQISGGGGTDAIRVTPAPASLAADWVTHWRLYRSENATGVYQFVTQQLNTVAYYDDSIPTADLGEEIPTWFVSDMGNTILVEPPPALEGIAQDMQAGMLVGWYDEMVAWSEPGKPDWWPAWYRMTMPFKVNNIIMLAGAISVLTEGGPYRIDGTNPELLQGSKALSSETCLGPATATNEGVVYLSDTGFALFNMVDVKMLTDKNFTEEWFKSNVTLPAVMLENDQKLYLFHRNGSLIMDMVTSDFTTADTKVDAAWKEAESGELWVAYQIDDVTGEIAKWEGGSDLSYTWESGDLMVSADGNRKFVSVEVSSDGPLSLSVSIDGTNVASKVVDMATARGRKLMLPEGAVGRSLSLTISGSAKLNEVIIGYNR